MMDLDSALSAAAMIGVVVVGIYWVFGLRLSWRATLVRLALSYAAVIFASQYADVLARSPVLAGLFAGVTQVQASALAFGLLLVVALLALPALFQVMWQPGPQGDSGAGRLLRSVVAAGAGVGVGCLLCASFFALVLGRPMSDIPGLLAQGWPSIAAAINEAALALVRPWLAGGLPLFLGG